MFELHKVTMTCILRALIAAFCLMLPAAAFGQGAVLQAGPTAPGRAPMYVGQGKSQAFIQDSGPAGGGGIGLGLAEQLLSVRSPTNTYPAANAGSGPFGTNWCDYDAPITNSTGYHYLCFSPNATQGGLTGGLITYGAGGGAPALPLQFCANGTCLNPAALPKATNSSPGTAQCDGVTTNCVNGVITAIGAATDAIDAGGATNISNGPVPGGVLTNNAGKVGNALVANAMLAPMSGNTVKCNPTGSSANAQDCPALVLGNATGGSQGTGTANVSDNYFVNGVPVATYNSPGANVSLGLSTYNPNDGQANNQFNLAIGPGALSASPSPNTNQNVATGWDSMNSLTGASGGQNTAYGSQTMPFATSTQFATAVGSATLRNITTGGFGSVAIGHGAAAGDDVFVGAGFNNEPPTGFGTGQQNTNVGNWSGQEQTSASGNACFGTNSCLESATGTFNTAMGFGALQGNQAGVDTILNANAVAFNVCVGNFACQLTSGGAQSIFANGYIALTSNPTVGSTITIGTTTVTFVASGASGNQANIGANLTATLTNLVTMLNSSSDPQLQLCKYFAQNGNSELAVQARTSGTPGNSIAIASTIPGSTAFGNGSGLLQPAAVTPSPITAVGFSALQKNVTGQENTAVGFSALNLSVNDTGNTAVGNGALTSTNGGGSNTAVGDQALGFNTTGTANTAVGLHALLASTTGSFNVAVGTSALFSNTTAGGETAVGASALQSNTTGNGNSALGFQALQLNTTGSLNTAVGQGALAANTTGIENTAVGNGAGAGNVTESGNTSVGFQAHFANDGFSNVTAIGVGATPTANNQIVLGNVGSTSLIVAGAVGVSCSGAPSASYAVTNGIVTHC